LVNKSFRSYIRRIEEVINLITVSESNSINYEMAGVLKELEPVPVLFENVREANFRVVGNLFMLVVTYSIS
jgi:3-polyprenyl-4-hydroxybenzoate decarboxylase